jgi:hypothetical protein
MHDPSRPTCLSWATVVVAFVALTSAAIAEGWNEYPVPKLARPGVAPGGRTGGNPENLDTASKVSTSFPR